MIAEWHNGDLRLEPESGDERAGLLLLWDGMKTVRPPQSAEQVLGSSVLEPLVHGGIENAEIAPSAVLRDLRHQDAVVAV